jgi:hypothetical protein
MLSGPVVYVACLIVVIIIGAFLPGWPFAWAGRTAADAPAPIVH